MNSKKNLYPLVFGGVFMVVAILILYKDEPTERIDTHHHDEPSMNVPMPGGTGSSEASSITGKSVPSNHDALMNIKMLKEQLQKNPNDLEHLIQLGNLLYDNGNFKDAIEPYGKALSIDPSNNNVRNDYAVCFFNSGNPEKAIAELNSILAGDKGNITATFNLGVIHANIGKTDAARTYFSRTIELQPNSEFASKARSMLGNVK